jgi:hypothetical protein
MSRLTRRRRVRAGGGGGDYGYLFDASNTALLPMDATPGFTAGRMRPNTATGLYDGTSVYTIEPTWGDTVAVANAGSSDANLDTNRAAIQAALNTAASSAVVNTKVVCPNYRGTVVLPPNVANVWIGLVPAGEASLPPLSPPTTTGLTRPTKAHRLQPSHFASCFSGRITTGNVPTMGVSIGQVRKYWVRGFRALNPNDVICNSLVSLEPSVFTFGGPVTSSTSTVTNFSGEVYRAASVASTASNRYAFIASGTGAGQVRRISTWVPTTGSGVLTVETAWTTTPDATSVVRYVEGWDTQAGTITTPNDFLPEDVFFMQCGGAGQNGSASPQTVRFIIQAGRRIATCDGYSTDLGPSGQDGQDCFVSIGAGPFKYTNCESYLGGPKESWMVGGRTLEGVGADWLPRNIEVRYNKIRDLAYGTRKTSIEVKCGTEGLIECNDCSDQRANIFGGEITIKLTNQDAALNNGVIDTANWTVRNNYVKDAGGTLQLSSAEGSPLPANAVRNIVVINNVQANADKVDAGMQINDRLSNVLVHHNTVNGGTATGEFAKVFFFANSSSGGYVQGPNIRLTNNVGCNPNALRPDRVIEVPPATLLPLLGTGGVISNNMVNVDAGLSSYASQLRTGTAVSSLGFINQATGDVRLSPLSPGYRAASGKDLGADVLLVTTLMADVV